MDKLPVKDLMCLYHEMNEATAAIMKAIDAANGMKMTTMVRLGRYEAVEHKEIFVYSVEQMKALFDSITAHIECATPKLIEAVAPPMPSE